MLLEIEEYVDAAGRSPFADWFDALSPEAAARVAVVIDRMGRGLLGDVKPVGQGVAERRIDFGPGYRIYFRSVRKGSSVERIVLLAGGTKKRQDIDIRIALSRWKDYRSRCSRG